MTDHHKNSAHFHADFRKFQDTLRELANKPRMRSPGNRQQTYMDQIAQSLGNRRIAVSDDLFELHLQSIGALADAPAHEDVTPGNERIGHATLLVKDALKAHRYASAQYAPTSPQQGDTSCATTEALTNDFWISRHAATRLANLFNNTSPEQAMEHDTGTPYDKTKAIQETIITLCNRCWSEMPTDLYATRLVHMLYDPAHKPTIAANMEDAQQFVWELRKAIYTAHEQFKETGPRSRAQGRFYP
ncbi:MAG: hypothetical protein V4735_07785 [Pseudomonadota bacterium]